MKKQDLDKGFDISQEYTFHQMKSLCPTYTYMDSTTILQLFQEPVSRTFKGESGLREYELNKRFPTAI